MKKTVCMLLALLLAVLVPVSALAEASGGTQSDEAVISGAIDALKEYWKQISGYGASDGTQSDEAVISGAIDALKEYWKQMYQSGKHGDGYLEIRSTRVFYIADPVLPEDDKKAHELFDDMVCFVEFVLLSDYCHTAPYYMNVEAYNFVALYRDGSYEVMVNPLNNYRAKTYKTDFTGFIRSVSDRGSEFNAVYHLLDD